mmetsp:Transcript_457/g.741  ORF Transcript_457/g.741 Transcript_457/m.741 type:complete len:373 (+) Transcript_457:1907-3025(+)
MGGTRHHHGCSSISSIGSGLWWYCCCTVGWWRHHGLLWLLWLHTIRWLHVVLLLLLGWWRWRLLLLLLLWGSVYWGLLLLLLCATSIVGWWLCCSTACIVGWGLITSRTCSSSCTVGWRTSTSTAGGAGTVRWWTTGVGIAATAARCCLVRWRTRCCCGCGWCIGWRLIALLYWWLWLLHVFIRHARCTSRYVRVVHRRLLLRLLHLRCWSCMAIIRHILLLLLLVWLLLLFPGMLLVPAIIMQPHRHILPPHHGHTPAHLLRETPHRIGTLRIGHVHKPKPTRFVRVVLVHDDLHVLHDAELAEPPLHVLLCEFVLHVRHEEFVGVVQVCLLLLLGQALVVCGCGVCHFCFCSCWLVGLVCYCCVVGDVLK